jgi:hypothetical protein
VAISPGLFVLPQQSVRNSLETLGATLRTTPPVVNWVFGLSLTVLLAKILWLNAMPEQFRYGYELGQLAENVLAAIVAAYIFFMISYQLPLVLERKAVGPTIVMLADQVIKSVLGFLHQVNYSLNARNGIATVPSPVTEQLVSELFAKISPNGASPVWERRTLAIVSWLDVMIDQTLQCREHIDQVWRYSRFIDPELAAVLEDIRFSQHARSLSSLQEIRGLTTNEVGNDNMLVWAGAYFRYYQDGLRLQEYCIRFRARYGISATYGSLRGARLET